MRSPTMRCYPSAARNRCAKSCNRGTAWADVCGGSYVAAMYAALPPPPLPLLPLLRSTLITAMPVLISGSQSAIDRP